MRAVLDTNVIVSGLLSPSGNARLILAMAFACKFDLIVSVELFAEYEAVIRRPKFRFRLEEIDEALTDRIVVAHVRSAFAARLIAPETRRLPALRDRVRDRAPDRHSADGEL